MPFYYRSLSLD